MPTTAHCSAWMVLRCWRMASPSAASAPRRPPGLGVAAWGWVEASSTVDMGGVLACHQHGFGFGVEVVEEVVISGRQAAEHQAGGGAGRQHLLLVQGHA